MSADQHYVDRLAKQGKTVDSGHVYAIGQLVLFAPTGSNLRPEPHLDHLSKLVSQGTLGRFAIANPDHAPYGRAAQEVLEGVGLWQAMQGNLVIGETAAQAAQFVMTGSVDAGIVPYSVLAAPGVRDLGTFALIPAARHRPIRQSMVLTTRAGETAKDLYRFLQTPVAASILERHGFLRPPAAR